MKEGIDLNTKVSNNAYKKEHGPPFSPILHSQCSGTAETGEGFVAMEEAGQPNHRWPARKPSWLTCLLHTCIWTPHKSGCWGSQFRLLQANFSSVSFSKDLFLIKRQKPVPKIFTAQYTDLAAWGYAWKSGPIHTFPIMLILKTCFNLYYLNTETRQTITGKCSETAPRRLHCTCRLCGRCLCFLGSDLAAASQLRSPACLCVAYQLWEIFSFSNS